MIEEFSDYKIGICSHAHSSVPFSVHGNHSNAFAQWAKDFNIVFLGMAGFKNAAARNSLVGKAADENCTHVLFLDVDHLIEPSLLPILLSHKGAAMVSGLICKRKPPYPQVGFCKDEDGNYRPINLPLKDKSYKVDVCAFGCTLIDLAWLAKLKTPYFRDEMFTTNEGELRQKRSDIIICERIKEKGGEIIIDTRAQVGHITDPMVVYPYNKDLFEQMDLLFTEATLTEREYQVPVYLKAKSVLKDKGLSRLIDLGCGDGRKVKTFLSLYASKIIGVDINQNKLLDAAAILPTATWIQGDLQDPLPFKFEKTDLILCADVLEHLENPKSFLDSIPKNIWCVFSTPDVETIVGDTVQINAGHKHEWTKAQFTKFLSKQGFTIEEYLSYDEISPYQGLIAICRKE